MKIYSNKIVTLEQAKSLLGDESIDLSNEDIEQLIEDLDLIAQYSVKMVQLFADSGSVTG